jgi:hypothetical protein
LNRKLSILPVIVAAFLLITFTAIPHHHHGIMMCVELVQGEDTHHGEEHRADNAHCVAETEYLVFENHDINGKALTCNHPYPILPTLFATANLWDGNLTAPITGLNYTYRIYSALYTSTDVCSQHGLRAPPIRVNS